jgi:N-sulfoglucosamine sulfohydrolase
MTSSPVRVILASLLVGIASTISFASEKLNILLLLSDDHSYPFLSCYGDTNVKTPTIDRLAQEGIRFHRYFTTCPQCVPSRASLMTGRSPVAARMTRFSSPLPRDEMTLPELLKSKGNYYTGVCGRSFHLDGSSKDPVAAAVMEKHGMKTFRDRVDFLQNSGDKQVAETVAKFLDARPSDRPFFMWANFSDPHHVWDAPSVFRPDPATLKLPAHWPDLPGVREQVADYCAEINRLDESIASVLKVLETRGLFEKTIIVFAGDNGVALPHGKGSLYDPGSNVPLIVRYPNAITRGIDSKVLLSGEDIAPTLLDAAGIDAGEKMSGRSFWNLVTGKDYKPRTHIFVERGPHGSASVTASMFNSGYDLSRAVRSDRYKLIYNCTPWIPYAPVDSAGGAAWSQIKEANESKKLSDGVAKTYFTTPRPVYELYDLDKDPSELENLAGDPSIVEVESSLREAMIEKMILDFDYLPLPESKSAASRPSQQRTTGAADSEAKRAKNFVALDKNGDGKLSKQEFNADRQPKEAARWFAMRDQNGDGYIDAQEYLPLSPASK